MHFRSIVSGTLVVLLAASCGGGALPTEKDINNSLEATLRSVTGDWEATSSPPNAIRLDFKLQEGSNGQVTGTGTMKEESAPAAVPITITGTFQRPVLSLAFDGMVYESHAVKGSAQGSYTTVGGIATTLTLTGPGYSRDITILMHEK